MKIGTNVFKNVNINIMCELNAKTTETITQTRLYPVMSTSKPNNGDVITVIKKNRLSAVLIINQDIKF
jgi:hypothetical protein